MTPSAPVLKPPPHLNLNREVCACKWMLWKLDLIPLSALNPSNSTCSTNAKRGRRRGWCAHGRKHPTAVSFLGIPHPPTRLTFPRRQGAQAAARVTNSTPERARRQMSEGRGRRTEAEVQAMEASMMSLMSAQKQTPSGSEGSVAASVSEPQTIPRSGLKRQIHRTANHISVIRISGQQLSGAGSNIWMRFGV